jgi:parvulin-like peptidyl-prolyl isomerase
MRRRFFPLLLLLPSTLSLSGAARAEIVERIVAKVNGEIITLSDFQQRQLAAAQAARVDPSQINDFLRQHNGKILQEAIDDVLLMQKAADSGMKAPAQWIDEAIDNIRKENNLTTEEQFQAALSREGLTLEELRQNIERGIVKRYILERDVRPKAEATEAELREEYEKLKQKEFTRPATVTLQEILVRDNTGGLALARQLVERARAGEDFQALARTYSSAPSRANGGDLGQIAQGDLNPDLEKAAFSLSVGSISEPLPVEGGYRVIKVIAKTSGSTTPFEAARDKVREKLMAERFEKEYDAYMENLRKGAVVSLYVREVPLQLTGPITESSLLEALDSGAPEEPPSAATAPAAASAPSETSGAAGDAGDEINTTPQAAPERVAPLPPAASPSPTPKPPDETPKKEVPPPPGR